MDGQQLQNVSNILSILQNLLHVGQFPGSVADGVVIARAFLADMQKQHEAQIQPLKDEAKVVKKAAAKRKAK